MCCTDSQALHPEYPELEFVEGDSKRTLWLFAEQGVLDLGEMFDLIHINGGRDLLTVTMDILHAGLLATSLTILVRSMQRSV